MTQCGNQKNGIVAELASIIKGLSKDEIEEVVSEAKRKASIETVDHRGHNLTKLFEDQFEKLKSLGCPQGILELLYAKREDAAAKILEMNIGEGCNIPFLPVIPRGYLGVYALMPMVKNGNKVGWTCLSPNRLTDVVETPKDPYYIIDVEDGEAMLGKSPEDAEKIIKSQRRSCLTVDEVIAVGIHTKVLLSHNIDAANSRYEFDDSEVPRQVPMLFRDRMGRPQLHWTRFDTTPQFHWSWFDGSDAKWGCPSCASRI